MAFPLSTLDQLDAALGDQQPRASKFAAKIRPRARVAKSAAAEANKEPPATVPDKAPLPDTTDTDTTRPQEPLPAEPLAVPEPAAVCQRRSVDGAVSAGSAPPVATPAAATVPVARADRGPVPEPSSRRAPAEPSDSVSAEPGDSATNKEAAVPVAEPPQPRKEKGSRRAGGLGRGDGRSASGAGAGAAVATAAVAAVAATAEPSGSSSRVASEPGPTGAAAPRARKRGAASSRALLTTDEDDMEVTGLTLRDIVHKFSMRDKAEAAMKQRSQKQARLAEMLEGEEGAGGAGAAAGGARAGTTAVAVAGPSSAQLTPQVQVINGRIVVTELEAEPPTEDAPVQYRRVEEGEEQKLNSHTYSNRCPAERWSKADTELFFKGLSQFGLDFTLIGYMFPNRNRRQIKNKYKAENTRNSKRVDDALCNRKDDGQHYKDIIATLEIGDNNEGD